MVYCFPTDIFLFEVLFESQLVNLDVCDKVFLIFLLLSEFQYTTDICQQLCGSLSVACPCNICKHHRRTKKSNCVMLSIVLKCFACIKMWL